MASHIPGELKVSSDCIADLAGYAALECYGIVGMCATDTQDGIYHILPVNRLRKGIDVVQKDNGLVITLHVVVEQGVNMKTVTDNLRESVKFLLSRIAQLNSVEVCTHIEGVRTSNAML